MLMKTVIVSTRNFCFNLCFITSYSQKDFGKARVYFGSFKGGKKKKSSIYFSYDLLYTGKSKKKGLMRKASMTSVHSRLQA